MYKNLKIQINDQQPIDEVVQTLDTTQLLMSANCCRHAFEAGQQSRQAEIDELQKRIDLIVDLVRDNTPDYWLDNMIQEILKGTTNEQ